MNRATAAARTAVPGFFEIGSVELGRDARGVSRARAFARDLLGRDHPAVDDVQLCLSELVTNALAHTASERIGVVVLAAARGEDRALRLEVVDAGGPGGGPRLSPSGPGDDRREHGRGLRVVADLTTGNWGSLAGATGRTTWAQITY